MAIVVEDGTGLENADSYCSVAEADLYLSVHQSSTSWDALSDSDKELALKRATRYLDTVYRTKWLGRKVRQVQSLAFPRYGVLDEEGWLYDSDEVPELIKNATAEIAVRSLSDALIPDITDPGTLKSVTKKVGPITKREEWIGGKSQVKKYREVDLLLRVFLCDTDVIERS